MIDIIQFIVRDFSITKMHFSDAVKFTADYISLRCRGMPHTESVSNARNAF
jgi:hypothetical protein